MLLFQMYQILQNKTKNILENSSWIRTRFALYSYNLFTYVLPHCYTYVHPHYTRTNKNTIQSIPHPLPEWFFRSYSILTAIRIRLNTEIPCFLSDMTFVDACINIIPDLRDILQICNVLLFYLTSILWRTLDSEGLLFMIKWFSKIKFTIL